MKRLLLPSLALTLWLTPVAIRPAQGLEDSGADRKVEMDIGINREHRDVGLKRLELLDKTLSRELMERKLAYVQRIEQDYNRKILELVNGMIPAIFNNKVMTHLDVNFFAPEYEAQVQASQKVAVSIMVTRDGLATWVAQNPSEAEALNKISGTIHTVFKIPAENISVLVVR